MISSRQVLWTLDNEIEPFDFERLCVDLLGRYGYRHIVPIGGIHDHGRDAEVKFWKGAADGHSVTVFQFSLQDAWEKKLREDAKKIAAHCPDATALVFVTSRAVTGTKDDALKREFKALYGWDLFIYSREWFRHKLVEFDQDLAKQYLDLDLPSTVGQSVTQIDLSIMDDEYCKDIFKHSSPELVRAAILESTRKEPSAADNWYRLARVDFLLRNYSTSLEAINKTLQKIDPKDFLFKLNATNFKGIVLAEKGIQERSRPLLIEAKEIFLHAVKKLKRAEDFYNLANVLGALGETKQAEKYYYACLDIKPNYAQAWKNLGSLLAEKKQGDNALACFSSALRLNPNLIEAHLSMANTYLMLFDCPERAIQCFETAYAISPELDQKWKYTHFWYSKALFLVGRLDDALKEIEKELLLRPDDINLLNMKAPILHKLRRVDAAYEEEAFSFFKFRAQAIREDYQGLDELIQIYKERGQIEEAWQWIDGNLVCPPFLLSEVAKKAELPISDFELGFQHIKHYGALRESKSVEDHCTTLCGYGLFPDSKIIPAINYALIAPFGVVANALIVQANNPDKNNIEEIFQKSLDTIARLFALFGGRWLAKNKPSTESEKINLLSIGMFYFPDIVIMEASQHMGYIFGRFGINEEYLVNRENRNWSDFRADVGVRLLAQVFSDWEIERAVLDK